MKRLLIAILAGATASLAVMSCKDDFNEQEFLQLQHDLKLEQDSVRRARNKVAYDSASKEATESFISAQNAAGKLMAATFVVREDNTPVPGVTVTVSSGAAPTGGRTQAVLSAITDALGTVVFDAVVMGPSVVTMSKTGYVTTTALISFPAPTAPVASTFVDQNGATRTIWLPPTKSYQHFQFPTWSESSTAGNTATINGVFNWQQDLTNDPNVRDPLPAGLVIAAEVSAALNGLAGAAGGITGTSVVSSFKFSGAAGSFGVGAIDPATGAFSIRVPATSAGLSIGLVYPVITANQRIAVRRLNGQDIAPEYRMVPTLWTPGATANAIPTIPGAKAVFNGGTPPPAPGRGFGVTFATIARALETGTITPTAPNTQFTLGNTIYNLNLRGRGYSSAPGVTITGGGGTGATATSSLRGFFTAAGITSGGVGYTPGATVDLQFFYTDASASIVQIGRVEDMIINGAGELPLLASVTLPNTPGFAGNATPFQTTQGSQSFGVRVMVNNSLVTEATATTKATLTFSTDTEVFEVQITNGGSGFTSAPTFAFGGGGSPSTNASLSAIVFKTRYTVTLGTTPATTPYKLRPAGMSFTFPGNAVEAEVFQLDAKVDRLSTNLTAVASNVNLLDHLVTDGTNLSASNPQFTFRTNAFGSAAPTLTVLDQNVQPAAANVAVSTAGEVSFTNPATDVGAVNLNLLIPDVNNTVVGDGYDGISVAIAPTIATAPGSGAQFLLTTTPDVNSKEVVWGGGTTLVSRGSGYLPNLNRTNSSVDYVAQSSITVRTGQTVFRLIEAGTGAKQENVQN